MKRRQPSLIDYDRQFILMCGTTGRSQYEFCIAKQENKTLELEVDHLKVP